MAAGERDDTNDWVLPDAARPASLAELEERIAYAVTVARASEAAALEIGAAAIDAAEQARRAAELAERASAGVHAGVAVIDQDPPGEAEQPAATREPAAPMTEDGTGKIGLVDGLAAASAGSEREAEYDSFKRFLERADRISARLESIAR